MPPERVGRRTGPAIIARGPRELQASTIAGQRARLVPAPQGIWRSRSFLEWSVWWVLTAIMKMVPEVDFSYQSPLLGGRQELGGYVVDFVIYNPPGIALNPLGEYDHYQRLGHAGNGRDLFSRVALLHYGIRLIFIDEADLRRAPEEYVRLALRGIDRSRLGAMDTV